MELRHLQYFVAVAEELSFTRASARLHVVQSGVSSAIQGLERELGVMLFDRDRHRVSLTDAGQALLPEARATLAAAQAAQDAVALARGGLRGTLTIGTMLSTGEVDLPVLLGRFHRAHPGVAVRLRLAAGGSAELAREVAGGGLDLALLSPPGQPPAGLILHELSVEPLLIVCRPEHPIANGPEPSLGRLADEPFIDFPPGWGNRAVVDRTFAAAGLDRQVLFEAADFATAFGLIRHGLGVAFIPASALAQAGPAQTGDLAQVALAGGGPWWRVSVAFAAGRRPSAAAAAFLAGLGVDTSGQGAHTSQHAGR
ncbi:MAG TPA: LysR family transcriptional regulator [Streptosporangiaceae bacterium]|jgi:DNA-binding transcriptional LysR family regulator|nr:LysR family transcriptional regulator [Streptosporangiaceae bacterium]